MFFVVEFEENLSEDNNKLVTFEYDNGDGYLGEVEKGEPHGTGVLKSKD